MELPNRAQSSSAARLWHPGLDQWAKEGYCDVYDGSMPRGKGRLGPIPDSVGFAQRHCGAGYKSGCTVMRKTTRI